VALEVKGNYGQYEATVGNLNKEIDELRRKLTEVGTRNKEYESKLIMTSQEIDRLDNIIKIKSEELGASKRENEELRRQYEELRRRWEDSSEVTRRIPEYEQKISLLIKEN
jgi:chromosome segregation ATPase